MQLLQHPAPLQAVCGQGLPRLILDLSIAGNFGISICPNTAAPGVFDEH
jgi:hypothetical protein